ncbi:vanadium-dependent haloperoxidase [Hymenobacter sp. GOD-10R]|uniref:vanadium-dependent haloperoxidase n=1 Tax=Hymenobacter sp. GOD-10R TaxID=3093922 RepID=UPI002D791998|nr:vanadium-dependent haloperoxidase [Hymenobacter sp. GOD-10R]WRQ27712.1 vanadium-dependent haloperoxidase [Hymenobacter sp. GOD-10R]
MKTTRNTYRFGPRILLLWLLMGGSLLLGTSCADHDPLPTVPDYRADVAVSWLNLQLRLVQTTFVDPTNTFGRPFAYAGIAGYEAAVPGLLGYRTLEGQLNGLTGLPSTDKKLAYNSPLSTNAALAAINRSFFSTTSAANLAAIDSLEATNKAACAAGLPPEVVERSVTFGKQVAASVWAWAQTDGYNNPAVYTLPTGPGLWVPTPPTFGKPVFPFWGSNRPIVASSIDNTDPGPPMAYSEQVGSPFYLMVKEVYDISQTSTAEQKATALFWNDVPNGRSFTPPGHWMSILAQVLQKEHTSLGKALMAYAKVGITLNDALISTLKTKYTYNLLRPITYIRNTMGQPTWNSLIPTPSYPEYSAGHAVVSGSAAEALTQLFGDNYAFTDQNYVQFGLGSRSYASFEQAGIEGGISRLYGGIHYRVSCEKGQVQGKTVARNINAKLFFKEVPLGK